MATVNLITLTEPRSDAAEAFRTLRTNLMFQNAEKPLTTIQVTSTGDGDDKSNTLANLAVAFAKSGNRTILVDTDLRKPVIHEIFAVDNTRGFTTMMSEDTAMSNPPLVDSGIENLSILPSGPLPDVPADMLSNRRLEEVIGVLKARANYILFDSPPVLAATDATLLGSRVDGVLLVVRAGHTRREHASRARQTLERVNINLLGAVLTHAFRETSNY